MTAVGVRAERWRDQAAWRRTDTAIEREWPLEQVRPWSPAWCPEVEAVVEDAGQPRLVLRGAGSLAWHTPPPPVPSNPGASQALLFHLPNAEAEARHLTFALGFGQILEIGAPSAVAAVPGSPEHFLGVTLWQKWAVPVFDLGPALGLGGSYLPLVKRWIFARHLDHIVALAVDLRMRPMSRAMRVFEFPLRPPARAEAIAGVFQINSGPLIVPHLSALLAAAS
jgi:chemotaxis signal transduction protein